MCQRFGAVEACDTGILASTLAKEEASGQEWLPFGTFSVTQCRGRAIQSLWAALDADLMGTAQSYSIEIPDRQLPPVVPVASRFRPLGPITLQSQRPKPRSISVIKAQHTDRGFSSLLGHHFGQ